jgi:hypothetical protein
VIATQDASSSPYLRYWRNDPHNTLSLGGSGSSPQMLDPLNVSVSPATATQIQQYWQNQYTPPGGYGNPNGVGYGPPPSVSSGTTCKADGGPLPCSMVLNWRNHGWVKEARVINNLGGVGSLQPGEWRKVPKWTDIPTGNPLQITARDDSYFEWVSAGYEQAELIPKVDKLGGGISEEDYNRIYNLLYAFVNSAACLKAFKDNLKGKDLADMLSGKGNFIRIGGFGIFKEDVHANMMLAMNRLGLNQVGAQTVVNQLDLARRVANAWTIGSNELHRVEGSSPTIILHSKALKDNNRNLGYLLLHELIHAAGWGALQYGTYPVSRWTKWFGGGYHPGRGNHDLIHVKGHDAILKACTEGIK